VRDIYIRYQWPIFFGDYNGDAITDTRLIREYAYEFLFPQLCLRGAVTDTVRFQQDGATSHTAGQLMKSSRMMSGNRIIFCVCGLYWSPRSLKLFACDFSLWGYLRSRVFVTRSTNLNNLKGRTVDETNAIPSATLLPLMENVTNRMTKNIDLDEDILRISRVFLCNNL
jgi:hypothetical protein